MSVRLELIELPEDIIAKLWRNDATGLVNSSIVRLEQDGDMLMIATLPTIDKIIDLLTMVRNETLETVKIERQHNKCD